MAVSHVYSQTVADGTAISLVRMREFLSYSPDTGDLVWLRKRTHNRKANVGDVAGGVDEHGYIRIMFDGKKYRAHRVAFVLMGLPMPEQVDHINGNRRDNRWVNLRPSNAQANARNACRRQDSRTALTGVTFSVQHGKWKVRINRSGVTQYLGLFPNLLDAAAARLSAQNALAYSHRHGKDLT